MSSGAVDAAAYGAESVLSCRALGGAPRYDLPAEYLGTAEGYEMYWRAPADVIHHVKQKRFTLPYPELVLVGVSAHHCISLSLDSVHRPVGGYVNINKTPRRTPLGWEWEDLELDVKLSVDYAGGWGVMLLDVHEFDAASFPPDLQQLAFDETMRVLESIAAGCFPFEPSRPPWLGLQPPGFSAGNSRRATPS